MAHSGHLNMNLRGQLYCCVGWIDLGEGQNAIFVHSYKCTHILLSTDLSLLAAAVAITVATTATWAAAAWATATVWATAALRSAFAATFRFDLNLRQEAIGVLVLRECQDLLLSHC